MSIHEYYLKKLFLDFQPFAFRMKDIRFSDSYIAHNSFYNQKF